MTRFIKEIKDFFLDAIFTVKCPYCGKVIERKEYACPDCKKKLPNKNITSFALGGYETVAPFIYKDIFAKAVRDFKFRENTDYAKPLALMIASSVAKHFDIGSVDIITCVPMHKINRKERGYNQSELLAKECANLFGIPYVECIEKHKQNKLQHTLKGKERQENVRGVFRVTDKALVQGKNILVIDDVLTTGATLGECCRVLKKAGCGHVCCAVLCVAVATQAEIK